MRSCRWAFIFVLFCIEEWMGVHGGSGAGAIAAEAAKMAAHVVELECRNAQLQVGKQNKVSIFGGRSDCSRSGRNGGACGGAGAQMCTVAGGAGHFRVIYCTCRLAHSITHILPYVKYRLLLSGSLAH